MVEHEFTRLQLRKEHVLLGRRVGMDRTWWNMSSLGYNRERNMYYWAGEWAWIEHGGT